MTHAKLTPPDYKHRAAMTCGLDDDETGVLAACARIGRVGRYGTAYRGPVVQVEAVLHYVKTCPASSAGFGGEYTEMAAINRAIANIERSLAKAEPSRWN